MRKFTRCAESGKINAARTQLRIQFISNRNHLSQQMAVLRNTYWQSSSIRTAAIDVLVPVGNLRRHVVGSDKKIACEIIF